MTSEKASETKTAKSDTSGSVPPLPSWMGLLVLVIVVAVVGLMLVPNIPSPADVKNQANDDALDVTNTPNASYPDSVFKVTLSPASPKAGDDVTITATMDATVASTNWKKDFSFEIWARQFGNWKIKSCYDTPCVYTYTQVSQGTLEYAVKRIGTSGDIVTEPAAGSYTINVPSGVQTGDTIPPHIVVTHDPFYPRVGQTITILASVNDISSLNGVDIYVDDAVVKTCPQQVKIAQCAYTTSALPLGAHSYYAKATDKYGNNGTSDSVGFNVLP